MKFPKILFTLAILSLAIAIACEAIAERLMKMPRWTKSRTVSLMLDSTIGLGVFGAVCLTGSFFSLLTIKISHVRELKMFRDRRAAVRIHGHKH